MAKKSAMSKGYRKTTKKKPFLSKKEIIELLIILAVILLGVVLFNIFYDDGFLRSGDIQSGDVVTYASSDLRDRYKKIAEIGELDGFTLQERTADDTPISAYIFNPDTETDNIDAISVNGSFVNAKSLVESTMSYMSSLADGSASETLETTIQDHDAYVYAYTYGEYVESEDGEAETNADENGEEPADNRFTQSISAYVAVDDTYTLCLHISRKGDDESFYLADDELVDFVQTYTGAFNLALDEE